MDPQRFDRLTRTLGDRVSRRTALRASAGFGGLALAGVALAPAAAQDATPVASPPTGAGPAWLLLQRFASATLSPAPDGAVLILEGAEPKVLAFTDRPARLARSLPAAEAWNWAADPADPPNATLLAVPAEGGDEVAVVVELVEASYDEAAGRVTATVRLLGEGNLEAIGSPTAVTEEQRFGAGHLFIDDLGDNVAATCVSCEQDLSSFLQRFRSCRQNGGSCDYCAGWVGCDGLVDTQDSQCGTLEFKCG